jgi:hypothetical protein
MKSTSPRQKVEGAGCLSAAASERRRESSMTEQRTAMMM